MTFSLDIATLSKAYMDGTLTPQAVIADVYKRIAADGEKPVWISLVPQDVALEKASKAPRGPLYGIPFAVKDNIDVAGVPTTCACPDFAYTPQQSARVVQLLEAAGAIAIGKTNLDQFATGLNGTRSPYGIPACVFDKDYVSGGSSSGSAVAVAAGLVSFALGTDTAGSGRVPAAFNNIAGLKPTKGTLSASGLVPACRSLDTISIFATTVSDAWAVYDIAAQYDDADAFSRARPASVAASPTRPRLGIPEGIVDFCGDDDVRALYEAALARARSLGADIVTFDYTPFRDCAALLYQGPWVAERYAAIKSFADTKPEAIHEVVRGIILGAKNYSAADTFSGLYRLAELTRRADSEWQKMDMMLLPSAPTIYTIAQMLADPIKLNSNLGLYTNFVNLMDLSALAVPAGFTPKGLPFGITLVGRMFEDAALARFGDALHRTLPDAKLGATAAPLAATPPLALASHSKEPMAIAVVGAHLSGQPLNGQLIERKARLVRTARTANGYSFYALANTTPPKPGLVYDGTGAGGIEVEIWEMDAAAFGTFVAMIPAPLGIGTLALADGTSVQGFVCEAHAVTDAKDITPHGGWRAYLASR
jgi:allophanate hydrolase